MLTQATLWMGTMLMVLASAARSDDWVRGRKSLVLEAHGATLVVDLEGGSIVDFHKKDDPLNPLQWAAPPPDNTSPQGFGHFLCLDRWGPASDAESARGMPYHGEAAHVEWKILRGRAAERDFVQIEMGTQLPLAGLSVKRTIRLSQTEALFTVREEIANQNSLGRIYNVVQHPTIGPPFLDETTVVDSNGRKGFAQGGSMPDPEEPSFYWPRALNQDGESVTMRRLTNDPNPNVVSYTIDDDYGWVTACTPAKQLLIGYFWKTRDYPWVSLWRDTKNGRPSARGLEFGTTGLHQPFPVLARKGRIFGRPLFEYLDAGETTVKAYATFLFTIPSDYAGVGSIEIKNGRFILHERSGSRARDLSLNAGSLLRD